MADPNYYTGSDDREDLAAEPTCEECGARLYPEEVIHGLCNRCQHAALDAGEDADGEDFRGDEAAAYEAECQIDRMALK